MDQAEIKEFEDRFIESRYSEVAMKREDAQRLVREVIRCHNEIATLKGEEIPFPDNRNRKVEKKPVGFDGRAG